MDGQKLDNQYSVGDGISMYYSISPNDNKVFAAISGDDSPVHFSNKRMAKTHFKFPIMNGIHTMSFVGATIVTAYNSPTHVCVVTEQHNSFISPVYINDTLEVKVKIDEVIGQDKYWVQAIVTNNDTDKVVVSARLKLRMIEA
jgi:acyl dehydratase